MEQIPMGEAPVQKDLIQVSSGRMAEAIYFNRPEKRVICFSTQLNCAVGCVFCASPGPGRTINLTKDEILHQVAHMRATYDTELSYDKPMLFSVMGEGEPLLNYKNVIAALHEISQTYDDAKFSLSTSGAAPERIKELAHEDFGAPFKLQVSIHSMYEDVRFRFTPLAKPISEIKKAIDYYHAHNDGPVELNFALIQGVNDQIDDVEAIVDVFRNEYIKISRYNPIENDKFKASSNYEWFVGQLRWYGLTVEYHATDGSKVGAACGQTRGAFEKK